MTDDRSHTMDDDPKMLRVNGFETLIESYAYQDHHSCLSLRVLSLIARESSMRAIRANMSLGHQVDIEGVGLLSWPRPSELEIQSFHRRLPTGLISSLWIPKTATAYGIEPNQPAYLVNPHGTAPTTPSGFIPLLDRLLPFPVLAGWAEALWQFGLETEWITPLNGHRLHAWEVHPSRCVVQDFITTRLQARALPVPASAEPEHSSTIHRRATDHENDRTSEGGILSDTGTGHPGHRPADSEPLQPLRPPL